MPDSRTLVMYSDYSTETILKLEIIHWWRPDNSTDHLMYQLSLTWGVRFFFLIITLPIPLIKLLPLIPGTWNWIGTNLKFQTSGVCVCVFIFIFIISVLLLLIVASTSFCLFVSYDLFCFLKTSKSLTT